MTAVEVCPRCDIAGCRHIRKRQAMTDLEKALAEVKRHAKSLFDHMIIPPHPAIATILNAAVSGTLIPATERDAAVAAALQDAGLAIANLETGFHDGVSGDWHPYPGPTMISAGCAAIRALINQPQADALARVRAETVSAGLAESRAYALALEQELRDRQAVAAPRMSESDFDCLILDAMAEAMKAMRKFPQPNYVISKVAEEAGEVVKAAIHCAEGRETAENLRGEMKQLIAMLYRLWIEGDQVHGLQPVSTRIRAAIGGVE